MKYDIFISCKSEDYYLGETIYNDLVAAGFCPFIASKELRKLGMADYGKSIESALESSLHLIIVTSNANYLREESSPYVYFEWHSFSEEKKSGRKKGGNILTVLTDRVRIEDLPYALRGYQSINYSERYQVVDYVKSCMAPRKVSTIVGKPVTVPQSFTNNTWEQSKRQLKATDIKPKSSSNFTPKSEKSIYPQIRNRPQVPFNS